jgi:Tfp pilus assembly protein PilF
LIELEQQINTLLDQGITYYNQHQYLKSIQTFEQSVKLAPDCSKCWTNLGAALSKVERYTDAIECYKKAIVLTPDYAGTYTNLGNALNKLGEYEQAVYFHLKAINLDDTAANHYANCGSAYKNLGRFDRAEIMYKKALSIEPKHVNAHFDLATVFLQTGAFEEGFSLYEWRFKKEQMSGHIKKFEDVFIRPVYKGQELSGESVLVHAEQGFGDALMVARYLFELKSKGAKVIVYIREGLETLFETMPCVDQVISRKHEAPETDFQLPMMSLPFICDKHLEKLNKHYPYFKIDKKYSLPSSEKLRIGIVWGASNTGESYKNKVFDLRHFASMAKDERIEIYSLQLGEDTKDIFKYNLQEDIMDLSKNITDFKSTAEMINALDLVITSDTSVAHLAGAMGAKVWILLQKVPDWRWGINTYESSWYPSARLFTQYSLGDWNSVFKQVYKELEKEFNIKVSGV